MSGASPRLYQRIVGILTDEISDGRLGAGERLVESRLARRFGVSRAPVRQALAELVSAGLVGRDEADGLRVLPSGDAAAGHGPPASARPSILTAMPSWQPIYAELEDQLTSRIAFCSWRVVETALAESYGVSRTVARDVLARLQQRGLVRNEGGKWVAPALSDRRVAELYALRAILEPPALRDAAERAPAKLAGRLRGRIVGALERVHRPTGDRLDALETDLHVTYLGHCSNRTLIEALVQHQSLLIAHRFLYRTTSLMYGQEPFLAEHLAVFDALISGDMEGAAAALERHLLGSRERAVERLERIRAAPSPDDTEYLRRLDS